MQKYEIDTKFKQQIEMNWIHLIKPKIFICHIEPNLIITFPWSIPRFDPSIRHRQFPSSRPIS
jgi:hypothetical protein